MLYDPKLYTPFLRRTVDRGSTLHRQLILNYFNISKCKINYASPDVGKKLRREEKTATNQPSILSFLTKLNTESISKPDIDVQKYFNINDNAEMSNMVKLSNFAQPCPTALKRVQPRSL